VYLSPGEHDVVVRLDMTKITLSDTVALDLSVLHKGFGGYSGGFSDGSWACFSPLRTYAGPVGGLRSELIVDRFNLRPYYYSVVLCIDNPAWEGGDLAKNIVSFDIGDIQPNLRGYADALRIGRFAYLIPFASAEHQYSSMLIRVNLGDVDIGNKFDKVDSEDRFNNEDDDDDDDEDDDTCYYDYGG